MSNRANFEQIFVRTASVYGEGFVRDLRKFLLNGGAPEHFADHVCEIMDATIFFRVMQAYETSDHVEMQRLEREMFGPIGANRLYKMSKQINGDYNHLSVLEAWAERVLGNLS